MSITIYKDIEVEVDVDIEDLRNEEIKQLIAEAAKRGKVPGASLLAGDGDQARLDNVIERAYLATRRLPEIPRELADLFWIVHGRACA